MHSIRHFYYQNKEKIWKVILVVVLVFGIIYFLNNIAIEQHNSKQMYSSLYQQEYYFNDTNSTHIQGTAAISGGNISKNEAEKINNTISKFLEYCKNGNASEAYAMVSEDCKNNLYNSLEKFSTQYLRVKFAQYQKYTVQKWQSDTYKIEILEDILVTGNLDNNSVQVEYITIVEENGEEKLNINSYIGKKSIGKENVEDSIRIKVIEKNSYLDYEEYKFEIENFSNKTIKLDSFEKNGTIYLQDSEGHKYNARMHEILEEETIINSKYKVNLSIKFSNVYNSTRKINNIIFENLILDYDEYKKSENHKDNELMQELKISL